MKETKLFMDHGVQSVELPDDCRFDCESVIARRIGDIILLIPKEKAMAETVKGFSMFSDDWFSEGRADLELEKRESM